MSEQSPPLRTVAKAWGMGSTWGTDPLTEAASVAPRFAFSLASSKSPHRDIGKAGGFLLPPFLCITPSQKYILCAREELKLSSIQR